MNKFKVGDWVELKNWSDFYEVVDVTGCGIKLKIDCAYTAKWYHVDENVFIKKEETMKLEVGGKYRMVGTHEPVRVICTDRKSSGTSKDFTCISLVCNNEFENTFLTTVEGKNTLGEVLFEKVPKVDWSNVPVDTPIWVAEKNYSKDYQTNTVLIKRHFADYSPSTGRVYFYYGGATSHTTDQPVQSEIAANCYLENPEV